MDARYVKTEAGRAALKDRSQALSRQARTLLLILDGSKTGGDWVGVVAGSSEADLRHLIELGLIERSAKPAPAPAPAAASRPEIPVVSPTQPAPTGPALTELLDKLSYRQLYDLLTAEARPRLGLINGYRVVLDVEKCNGAEEIRSLALRFIELVRKAQGAEGVRQVCLSFAQAAAASPAV